MRLAVALGSLGLLATADQSYDLHAKMPDQLSGLNFSGRGRAAMPDEPLAATPYGGCRCDPKFHFSPFTTCTVDTSGSASPHVVVSHSQHKKCHPLTTNYLTCIEVANLQITCNDLPESSFSNDMPVHRATRRLTRSPDVPLSTTKPTSAR